MQVTITIPQNIIDQCAECGWNETQTKAVFQEFVSALMDNGYGQFETDFDIWLNDLDDSELAEILN